MKISRIKNVGSRLGAIVESAKTDSINKWINKLKGTEESDQKEHSRTRLELHQTKRV